MTDTHKQRLSELLDGELASAATQQLLDTVAEDTQLRATWERYHLIGQAIRRESIKPAYRTCADEVRRRVASEPTVLAPGHRWRPTRRGIRRTGGLAVAASVAIVAALTAPALLRDAQPSLNDPAESVRLVERESISMQRLQIERPQLADKLDLYLVTHQATAPATAAKGMLPYATLVGYEAPR